MTNAQQIVTVKRPDGGYSDIPADSLAQALDAGYRVATDDERHELDLREKYGDESIIAGLAGGARGLSMGLSDVALTKSGLVEPETLRALRKYNPMASTVGELTGAVAPLVASGGSSGAASLLSKAGTLPRLVAGAGAKTAAGAAATLGAGTIARRAGAAAAGAAVEGGLWGAGQALTEAALEEQPLTVDKIITHMGYGALVGGAFGGATTAGVDLIGALGRNATRTSKKILGKAVADIKAKIETSGKGKIGIEATLDPVDESVLKKYTTYMRADEVGQKARKAAKLGETQRASASRKMAAMADEQGQLNGDVYDFFRGEKKTDFMRQAVPEENTGRAVAEANNILNEARMAAKRMGAKMSRKATREIPELDDAQGTQVVRDFARLINSAENELNRAIGRGESVGGEVYIILDRFKRNVGSKFAKPGRYLSMEDESRAGMFREFYNDVVQPRLEDAAVWGDDAADAQKAINKAVTRWLKNDPEFQSDFARRLAKGGGDYGWDPRYRVKPDAVENYFNNLGKTNADIPGEHLREQIAAQLEVAETVSKYVDLDSATAAKVAKMRDNASAMLKLIDDTEVNIAHANNLRDLAAGKVEELRGFGPMAMPSAQKLSANLVFTWSAAETAAAKVESSIKATVSEYTRSARGSALKLSEKTKRVMAPSVVTILNSAKFDDDKPHGKTKREAFRFRSNELARVVADPEAWTRRVAEHTADIGGHSGTATQVALRLVHGAHFLYEKMPKDPRPQTLGHMAEWNPSDAEIDKFSRYYEAVVNPLSVLEHLKRGTLTMQHTEALQVVYPSLYERIVGELAESVSMAGERLRYRDRVQLSVLFGVPLDSTMAPEAIMRAQALYAQPAPSQANPAASGGPLRATGMKNLTLAERSKSRTQQLAG